MSRVFRGVSTCGLASSAPLFWTPANKTISVGVAFQPDMSRLQQFTPPGAFQPYRHTNPRSNSPRTFRAFRTTCERTSRHLQSQAGEGLRALVLPLTRSSIAKSQARIATAEPPCLPPPSFQQGRCGHLGCCATVEDDDACYIYCETLETIAIYHPGPRRMVDKRKRGMEPDSRMLRGERE